MLGWLVFGVIVLLVSWSGVKVIQSNYDLQKQIARLRQQTEIKQLENTNLRLRNEYYNTDQYLELAARRFFGKAADGETLLLVPEQVALAHTLDLPRPNEETIEAAEPPKSAQQQNFEAWLNFLFHRQGNNQ